MAYQPEEQQKNPGMWGQAPPPYSQFPPSHHAQLAQPHHTQWTPSNETWRTVPPGQQWVVMPPARQPQVSGNEGRGTPVVLVVLSKLFVLSIGIAASTFGIMSLAHPLHRRQYCYHNPSGGFQICEHYSVWPEGIFAGFVAQSSLVSADTLIAAVLLILPLAKPKFKLGIVPNALLVIFNIIIAMVGGWLLVNAFFIDGGRHTHWHAICATVFTLILPVVFILTYLRLCCSCNLVMK